MVVPRLDENGKRLANVYNIKVIEAKGREETLTALKTLLTQWENNIWVSISIITTSIYSRIVQTLFFGF